MTCSLIEGASQIMQLTRSSQRSTDSLAESDTSEKLGNKGYRTCTRFTPHQLSTMESAFAAERYPDAKARQELSEKLGLSEVQVQVRWLCQFCSFVVRTIIGMVSK